MIKKQKETILIALCTAAALIAFAFYQRYETPVTMPALAFYIAAAMICALPYTGSRRKACRSQPLKLD